MVLVDSNIGNNPARGGQHDIIYAALGTPGGSRVDNYNLGNNASLANVCLPTNALNFPIMGYWDDLMTNTQTGCTAFASGCGRRISTF